VNHHPPAILLQETHSTRYRLLMASQLAIRKMVPAKMLIRSPVTQQVFSRNVTRTESSCLMLVNDSRPSKVNPTANTARLILAERYCLELFGSLNFIQKQDTSGP
jgi:hypothetical protein